MNAVDSFPFFDLQELSTALVLSSVRDHPIRLNSALALGLLASYPLTNERTEAVITPSSLKFTPDGRRFVAGSDDLISIFDLSRPGHGPVSCTLTSAKRNSQLFNPATNMKGIVSSLAFEPQRNVLAGGTFTRQVGIYEASGDGECVGTFTTQGTEADHAIGGRGITQLNWSSCGTYLYITERKANGIVIYDLRNTGKLVCWLEGREAMTNQRLGLDLVCGEGHEVWAGGTDGIVRVWKAPYLSQGPIEPQLAWVAHNGMFERCSLEIH